MVNVLKLVLSLALVSLPLSRAEEGPEPIVVGGVEAPAFKYSNWTVGLLSRSGRRPFCGASYIGEGVVLTAAHCVVGSSASSIRTEALRHDWNNNSEKGVSMLVTKIDIHPEYGINGTDSNDIALLRVNNNGYTLPFYPELDDGTVSDESASRTFKVVGWGATREGGPTSSKLLEANVDLVSQKSCQDLYRDPTGERVTESMICAKRPGIDTCQGDSGGPMFVDGTVPVIVGLTSWGEGCARAQPGVYSRVSYLRAFVDKTLGCAAGTTFTGGKCQ